MGGFLQRVFKLGQLPAEVTAAIDGAHPLLIVEGVTMKASGKLKSPQRRSSGFTKMHVGALVILPGRVLASFGRYVVIDDTLAALPTEPCTTCTIDGTGLRVTIDVERLIPGSSGHVDVKLRTPIPADILATLPSQWSGGIGAADPARLLMKI